MGDCNHSTQGRALTVEDDITVVFHKVASHDTDSRGNHDDCAEPDERTAERVRLQSRESYDCDDSDAPETKTETGEEHSQDSSEKKTLCPSAFCGRRKPASPLEGRRTHAHQVH